MHVSSWDVLPAPPYQTTLAHTASAEVLAAVLTDRTRMTIGTLRNVVASTKKGDGRPIFEGGKKGTGRARFFFSRFRLYLFSNSLVLLALNPPLVNPS